jgi:hypothetical protein
MDETKAEKILNDVELNAPSTQESASSQILDVSVQK